MLTFPKKKISEKISKGDGEREGENLRPGSTGLVEKAG